MVFVLSLGGATLVAALATVADFVRSMAPERGGLDAL